jgi:prevent-host-death family protein
MKTVGAGDARKHFSALLDRVAEGERITITRRGVPAALLVPVEEPAPRLTHRQIVDGLRSLRSRVKPGNESVTQLIEEGRRF